MSVLKDSYKVSVKNLLRVQYDIKFQVIYSQVKVDVYHVLSSSHL